MLAERDKTTVRYYARPAITRLLADERFATLGSVSRPSRMLPTIRTRSLGSQKTVNRLRHQKLDPCEARIAW